MKRYFVNNKNVNLSSQHLTIDGEEFNHAKNVMRHKIGDELICFSGDGVEHICEIVQINKTNIVCLIKSSRASLQTPTQNVTLFQGALKNNNFELVIQKMAELGLSTIVPFESDFSVAKIKQEKIERFNKISKSASKQCGRADFLKVENKQTFKQLTNSLKNFDLVVFAYENQKTQNLKNLDLQKFKGKKIALVIGSEGGFSKKEANALSGQNVLQVSLGKRVLRAETAAITLASIAMFLLDEL